MKKRYLLTSIAVAVLAAACSSGVQESHSLVPRSCAEPGWDHLTPQGTVAARRGTEVGVTIAKGRGNYALDEAFVEVLRPDAVTDPDLRILRHENPAVLATTASGPAADRRVVIEFRGVDAAGAALPPGLYPVVFAMRTTPAGRCKGSTGYSVNGVLATLDWRG